MAWPKGKPSPMKGKHHTPEVRRKISKSLEGHAPWNKGKHHTPEARRKMSNSLKGEKHPLYGKHHNPKTKRKIGDANRGHKHTPEARRKISKSLEGDKNPNYGKHHTPETRRKMSQSLTGRKLSDEHRKSISERQRGEKHWHWKGGAKKYYGPSWYRQRSKALKRDGYICKKCKGFETNGCEISVHHIIRFGDFGLERHLEANDLSNLVTLCSKCHRKIENDPNGIKICRELILSLMESEKMKKKTVIVAPIDADKNTIFGIKPDHVCKGKDDQKIIQKALDSLSPE